MLEKVKHIIFVISVLFFTTISKAQHSKAIYVGRADMAKIFQQMNNWFLNTTAYSLTVTHSSYEDYITTVPADKSVGYFKKDKNNYHSFLLGIHTVQNKNYKIVVDSSQKIMVVANPDQLIWNNYTFNQYDTILKMCSTITMLEKGKDKLYHIGFNSQSPLSAYEFLLGPDGLLKEIVWYSNQEIKKDSNDETSEITKPRVSIVFSNYKEAIPLSYTSEFDENNYLNKNNNKLSVSDKYKKYRLLDQRFNKG